MIFTSLSPNTQRDDILLAFKRRLMPWSWPGHDKRIALEQTLSNYIGGWTTFAFDSGRTSLFAILSTLGITQGDEVLVQAYTCVAVPEPVLWVGAKPVYVDCLEDLTMSPDDLEQKITSKSKVLIIQHTFGMPAKIDELMTIAKKHNLYVIEDCAHALGATYHGKPVGTYGDASFFSFGRDKVLSSVFGGVLAVKDGVIAQKVKALYDSFPESSPTWVKKQLNHPLIFAVAKPTYSFLYLGRFIIEGAKRLGLFSKAVETVELSGGKPSFAFKKMAPVLAELALHQFAKLEKYKEHRQQIAALYNEALNSASLSKPAVDKNRQSIYLRYTLFTKSPQALMRYMQTKGVMLGDWYTEAIAPKRVDYKAIGFVPESCPTAARLASQSVNLPTHIQLSKKQAQKIAKLVNEYSL